MAKQFLVWFWIVLLIIIHTTDMELTRHYIGESWEKEGFPIMSLSIKNFGINISLWLSRIAMYSFMYFCLLYSHRYSVRIFLIMITILYWMAMLSWFFTLGIVAFPWATW